ncbi:MAG: hypothetical protein VKI82_08215 [Leptolyngbya sp.]|nr:hypothetical protein [Leptolyngbya sp.]
MISATLTATNGHSPAAQPWLRESVQTCFEGVNWSGLARRSAPSSTSATAASPVLDAESLMALSVGQFFEMMSWEGKPNIGVPIAPLEAPAITTDTASDDITLDDFSSLFG